MNTVRNQFCLDDKRSDYVRLGSGLGFDELDYIVDY